MQQQQTISSIDKVLEYIQQDIENPDKEGVLDDLIDVHALLTTMKARHIEKSKDNKTLPEDLYVYSYMVMQSFKVVFGGLDAFTKVLDDRVMIYNDLIYMDINRDNEYTECIISFYHRSNPVIVAEIINTLKDMFGVGLKVSNEVFVIDEATGNYIWGDEAIQQHLKNVSGVKIAPMVFFDDDTVGNC